MNFWEAVVTCWEAGSCARPKGRTCVNHLKRENREKKKKTRWRKKRPRIDNTNRSKKRKICRLAGTGGRPAQSLQEEGIP